MVEVIINLRGVGVEYVKGAIELAQWKKIEEACKNQNQLFERLVFEDEFISFLKIPGLNSWRDLNSLHHCKGLLEDPKSHIELRVNDNK